MAEEKEEQDISNNQNEENIDIKDYEDPEGLTVRKMNIGLWFSKHRKHIKNILITLLAIFGVVLCIYSIYHFTYYISRGMDEDELLVRELVQTSIVGHDYILAISAQDLVYTQPTLLKIDSNKYDIFSRISNSNPKHLCHFKYCFISGGGNNEIECSENFIFPNETKYLLSLAQTLKQFPSNLQLVIRDIYWQRINLHKYPDWPDFYNQHLDIVVDNIKFQPAELSGLSEKIDLNILEFTVSNNTAYNYWDVSFNIFLYSGNKIVGINKYILQELMSKETRDIQMSWPGRLGRINSVEIVPEVDIINDNIYIEYEGGIGQKK